MLKRLQERFQSAEADVDAAKRRARQASAARLAALLSEPKPATRVAGLKDASLTAFDRAQLERAIAEEMPHRRIRRAGFPNGFVKTTLRHAGYHRRKLVTLTLIMAPLLFVVAVAAWRTPKLAIQVTVTIALDGTWKMADGSLRSERIAPGAELVWLRRGRQGYLRKWFPSLGYGEVAIDDEVMRLYVRQR